MRSFFKRKTYHPTDIASLAYVLNMNLADQRHKHGFGHVAYGIVRDAPQVGADAKGRLFLFKVDLNGVALDYRPATWREVDKVLRNATRREKQMMLPIYDFIRKYARCK